MIKRIFWWTAVIFWLCLIYYFSSQPDLGSGLPDMQDFILRKGAHGAEFFVLTYLLLKAFLSHNIEYKIALALAVVIALPAAGFDEFHQSFVLLREGKLVDVIIDALGVFGLAILNTKYGKNLSN